MPTPGRAERLLTGLLRGTAVVMATAIVPAVMPLAWMDAVHRALGMGPLPSGPVVEYLARCLSGFYAFHGLLLWIFAGDLRRYATVVAFSLAAGLVAGLALIVVDLRAGLPGFWVAGEGPFVAALSAFALALLARVRAGAAVAPPPPAP